MPNVSHGEGGKDAREYAYVRELLLDIRQVSFQVGGRLILDRLDLTIQPSEIHALLGANGSGKDGGGMSGQQHSGPMTTSPMIPACSVKVTR